jgi:hypothetical protein
MSILPSKRAAEMYSVSDPSFEVEVLADNSEDDGDNTEEDEELIIKQRNIKRCASCNRKVGLTGMECKCRLVFCSAHRYPEQHNCDYDYKLGERKHLERSTPGGGTFAKVDRL